MYMDWNAWVHPMVLEGGRGGFPLQQSQKFNIKVARCSLAALLELSLPTFGSEKKLRKFYLLTIYRPIDFKCGTGPRTIRDMAIYYNLKHFLVKILQHGLQLMIISNHIILLTQHHMNNYLQLDSYYLVL